ncbi:MAG: hypothetical protein HGB26_08540 [Desulfobulbaceae bacterium]|nr:hypothetical protein [Desulfobulbaceae bacterium]
MRKDFQIAAKTGESIVKAVLPYFAVVLSLFTALLYLYGRIHYGTYLNAWGLPEDFFPLSKEESIIAGFFRVVFYGAKSFIKFKFLTIALPFFVIAAFLSCYKPISAFLTGMLARLRGKVVPVMQRNIIITPTSDKLVDVIGVLAVISGSIMLLLLLFILSCQWFSDEARESAKNERVRIKSGTIGNEVFPHQPRVILYVKNESNGFDQYSGHLIKASATHCALYNTTKGVEIFPLPSVSRMVIHEVGTRNK